MDDIAYKVSSRSGNCNDEEQMGCHLLIRQWDIILGCCVKNYSDGKKEKNPQVKVCLLWLECDIMNIFQEILSMFKMELKLITLDTSGQEAKRLLLNLEDIPE